MKAQVYQNLWDTLKTVLRGKFIAINPCLKKEERFQINNPTSQLKETEKQQTKPNGRRKKEIIKFIKDTNEE